MILEASCFDILLLLIFWWLILFIFILIFDIFSFRHCSFSIRFDYIFKISTISTVPASASALRFSLAFNVFVIFIFDFSSESSSLYFRGRRTSPLSRHTPAGHCLSPQNSSRPHDILVSFSGLLILSKMASFLISRRQTSIEIWFMLDIYCIGPRRVVSLQLSLIVITLRSVSLEIPLPLDSDALRVTLHNISPAFPFLPLWHFRLFESDDIVLF